MHCGLRAYGVSSPPHPLPAQWARHVTSTDSSRVYMDQLRGVPRWSHTGDSSMRGLIDYVFAVIFAVFLVVEDKRFIVEDWRVFGWFAIKNERDAYAVTGLGPFTFGRE